MAEHKHISIGRLGEDIATKYLENRGFTTIVRNYRKKWGEIDIIVEKDNVLHFVEVKTGSWKGSWPRDGVERYRPEDHVHTNKKARLRRAIESYLAETNATKDTDRTADLVVVLINEETKAAHVQVLGNILLI